jgi:hypothetical protein
MSTKSLFRLAAAALIVSAVAVTAGRILHPPSDAVGLTSPLWGASHLLWLVGLLTGLVGVFGLYLRQREEVGWLGFFGAGLAWVGMAWMSGAIYFEAIIEPSLLARHPTLVEFFLNPEQAGVFIVVFLASVALYALGFLAFGIAMLRAAVLPRWAIVLLIVGSVIGGPQGFLPTAVAVTAMLALGAGLLGLGYGLWRSVDESDTYRRVQGGAAAAAAS